MAKQQQWEIKPESPWLGVGIKEIISYKDLLLSLTRKEFLGSYQQTLLGPLWVLLSPLLTVLTYVLVFNIVIGVPTEGVPPFLFNLIGITLWNLFSEIFLNTSKTFTQNAHIFGKVYFPRIIVALSTVLLQLLLFAIQLLLVIGVTIFFAVAGKINISFSHMFLIVPVILMTTGTALGGGLIFSVLTTKYRDLLSLIQLIIRLLMFVCPIFYPMSMVPKRAKWFVDLNPLSSHFELFRNAFLGKSYVSANQIMYSVAFMAVILVTGVFIFNKKGDELMDVL